MPRDFHHFSSSPTLWIERWWIAHSGNLPRVLPEGLGIRLQTSAWRDPAIFRTIQEGGVAVDEMYRTFNMGIGMIAIVAPEDLHDVEHSLERRGEASFVVGSVTGEA